MNTKSNVEYKVLESWVYELEAHINEMAEEGWKPILFSHESNIAPFYTILERPIKKSSDDKDDLL